MSSGNSSATPPLEGAARGLRPGGLIAVTWVGCAVGAVLVALRCYVRLTERRRLYLDDYWMLAALFFLIVNAVLQTLQTPSLYVLTEAARGLVLTDVLTVQGNTYVRYEFVIIALFWSVIWSVKASFLSMYYRLFTGLPSYRRVWWGVVIFAVLSYIGCWVTSAYTCHPPSTYFDFGQCSKPIDLQGSIISVSYSTAVDVLLDLAIMALPLGILPSLQVSRRQQLGLGGIFSVGLIVIAAALLRMSQIVGQARTDPVGLGVWGIVESSISVMVGSLPALKSFLGRTFQRTKQSGSTPRQYSWRTFRRELHSSGEIHTGTQKSWSRAEAIPLEDCEGLVAQKAVARPATGHVLVEREWSVR